MLAIFPRSGCRPGRLTFPHFLFLLIFSIIHVIAIGQNAHPDGSAALRLNDVNSHAARHFLSHFSTANGVKWTKDDHFYVACFITEQSTTRVFYKSNGNFAYWLKYYRSDALNRDLKSAILKKFPGCQILVITELTDDLYKQALFVNIKYGRNVETLRCDDNGIEVTENIEDVGI